MITIDLTNNNPMDRTGIASSSVHTLSSPLTPTTTAVDFANCITKFKQPNIYKQKVFFHTEDSTDTYRNDKNSFLYSRGISSASLSIELWDCEQKLDDLNDNTYGTFYDFGFSSTYENYTGYVIDWLKVYNAFGSGYYVIKGLWSLGANSYTYESPCFWLLPYSPCNAQGTVKIKWTQNGNIISSFLNYAGLEWENWARVPGYFGRNEPSEEIDEIEKTDRSFETVNLQSIDNFTLETKQIPFWLSNILDKNAFLGSTIEITDYNQDNHRDDLIDFKVRFAGYGERSEQRGNQLIHAKYNFKRRIDDDLKREYPKP